MKEAEAAGDLAENSQIAYSPPYVSSKNNSINRRSDCLKNKIIIIRMS